MLRYTNGLKRTFYILTVKERALLKYIQVSPKKCHGCTHCMRHCPVEAIRIRKGIATIDHQRCILCGRCLDDCPYHAISIVSPKRRINSEQKIKFLIIQEGFYGHFPTEKHQDVREALRHVGYDHILDCRDFIRFHTLWNDNNNKTKKIFTTCNVIKNLIEIGEVKTDTPIELVPKISELLIGAIHLLYDDIDQRSTSITLTTHCMSENYNGISHQHPIFLANDTLPTSEIVNTIQKKLWSQKDQKSSSFHLPDTEEKPSKEFVYISGIEEVKGWIHKKELKPLDYTRDYNLQGCKYGCYNGTYMSEYASIIKKREAHYQSRLTSKYDRRVSLLLQRLKSFWISNPQQNAEQHEGFKEALIRSERIRKLMCLLPGIDCGVCGAPSCLSLAKDISKGEARLAHCVLLDLKWMQNRHVSIETTMLQLRKIWGKKILQFDCTKKGAKNEIIQNRRDQ
ncbi:MAG: 4Fe-4S binding protein [Prolixibacteraceae bacterium]|nr:4Fe-4S binding protein [Prolixibacteraceae bacterium]